MRAPEGLAMSGSKIPCGKRYLRLGYVLTPQTCTRPCDCPHLRTSVCLLVAASGKYGTSSLHMHLLFYKATTSKCAWNSCTFMDIRLPIHDMHSYPEHPLA